VHSRLPAAQALINAGQIQAAINTLIGEHGTNSWKLRAELSHEDPSWGYV